MAHPSKVQRLRDRGFDASYYAGGRQWKVRCSQCEALVVNGVPCHEKGCPNEPKKVDEEDA